MLLREQVSLLQVYIINSQSAGTLERWLGRCAVYSLLFYAQSHL